MLVMSGAHRQSGVSSHLAVPKRCPFWITIMDYPSDVKAALSTFDLDDPSFPEVLADYQMQDGGYPYQKKLKRSKYEARLEELQIELVKLQQHMRETGQRWSRYSKAVTPPAKAARSSTFAGISTRVTLRWRRCPSRRKPSAANGISSAM
jgi:hypothetical protein